MGGKTSNLSKARLRKEKNWIRHVIFSIIFISTSWSGTQTLWMEVLVSECIMPTLFVLCSVTSLMYPFQVNYIFYNLETRYRVHGGNMFLIHEL